MQEWHNPLLQQTSNLYYSVYEYFHFAVDFNGPFSSNLLQIKCTEPFLKPWVLGIGLNILVLKQINTEEDN
jgi:hypothetical protein